MSLKEFTKVDSLTAPWPYYDEDEVSCASNILQSGKVSYWTGQEGRLFEKEFADYAKTQNAVALANGTVTLECILSALDLHAGDEVIVTPRSFIASASSVINQGGIPVFADVDRASGNLSANTISEKLTSRTKAVIVVHLAGWPAEMDEIMDLAKTHNLFVIEDCAQAHGATYKGNPVGGIGHVGSWSFCQDKIISTAGEGGMITTNDNDLWAKCWALKDHGKNYDAVYNREHPIGFRWLHESIGTNWRLTEIQSAIGRIQLRKLKSFSEKRTNNAKILSERLKGLSVVRIEETPGYSRHAYYKYYCYVNPEALKSAWNRDRIIAEIESKGVPAYSGSCSEIYLEKAFVNLGLAPENHLPVAKELGDTSLMFLVHPTLTLDQMRASAEIIRNVLLEASR